MLRILVLAGGIGIILFGGYVALSIIIRPSIEVFDIDINIADSALEISALPKSRPFLMSYTNQPFDWNEQAFQDTARLIEAHADAITIFYDVGVPWHEAFEGKSYHPAVEADIQRQVEISKNFQNVILLTSFLASDRVNLSFDATGETGMERRSGVWADLDFNDPQVVTAYLNYCRDLIERFQPDYFGYVAEIDAAYTNAHNPRFLKLRDMAKTIYETLKAEYPALTVFIEFNLGDKPYMEERKDVIDALLPYSDLYALSTYPDHFDPIAGDAMKLPSDWFTRANMYAKGKPIAILETGFLAEPFMHPTLGIRVAGRDKRLLIPGGEKSQALYIKRLLEAAILLDMEFVNLWAIRDLDPLFEKLALSEDEFMSDPMAGLAKNIGLYDRDGNPRPALDIWDAWFRIPLQQGTFN